jgi:hypothetical protein
LDPACTASLLVHVSPPQSVSYGTNSVHEFANAFLDAQIAISECEHKGIMWPSYELFRNKTDKPMPIVNVYLEPIIKVAAEKQNNAPITRQND